MDASEIVARKSRKNLEVYHSDPSRLHEDFNIEKQVLAGGYGYRQVLELVQNGADAVLENEPLSHGQANGRIHVGLYGDHLYVANTGQPFTREGYQALLGSHVSTKRENQIGRFGIGFKSVLKFGGVVDIFSRSNGDIRFDPQRCRRELSAEFQVDEAPALRQAWPLAIEERRNDEHVYGLLGWAETVVRAQLAQEGVRDHIHAEIAHFPVEFLLFMPPGLSLTLHGTDGEYRTVTTEKDDGFLVLNDDGVESKWLVRSHSVSVDDVAAREDATHIHARDSVPLSWAVPVFRRQEESGRFWAFFPTDTDTWIPGILNAPWKTNSDRRSVLTGDWNSFLMRAAAELVVAALPQLSSPADPGRPLDAFPRRVERQDAVAVPLIDAIDNVLVNAPVVPDGLATLRTATDLWLFPEKVSKETAERWYGVASDELRGKYVHPSVLSGQRISRLRRLLQRSSRGAPSLSNSPDQKQTPSVREWVNALIDDGNQQEEPVLRLVDKLADTVTAGEWKNWRHRLRVVPVHDGQWRMPDEAIIALELVEIPGKSPVRASVASNEELSRILTDRLDVRRLEKDTWKDVLLEAVRHAAALCRRYYRSDDDCAENWRKVWRLLRNSPESTVNDLVVSPGITISAFTRDGQPRDPQDVLLPGCIVTTEEAECDSGEFNAVLLDEHFHEKDHRVLSRIGCRQMPEGLSQERKSPPELSRWRRARAWEYKRRHRNRAAESYLEPKALQMPHGWRMLTRLAGLPNARLTHHYLGLIERQEVPETVTFGHSSRDEYPKETVRHPLPWWLMHHGTSDAGGFAVPLKALLSRADVFALQRLRVFRDYPKAMEQCRESLGSMKLEHGELTDMWARFIETHDFSTGADLPWEKSILTAACQDGFVPDRIAIDGRERAVDELAVGTSESLARRASMAGHAAIVLDKTTADRWVAKGARSLDDITELMWDDAEAISADLRELIPEFAQILPNQPDNVFETRTVDQLRASIDGQQAIRLDTAIADDRLILDRQLFASRPRREQFECILCEAVALGWVKTTTDEALAHVIDESVQQRRRRVFDRESLSEKVLECAGGRREPLLELLSTHASVPTLSEADDLTLAKLALAAFGPTVLSELGNTLEAEGLQPPERWSRAKARRFVTALGFPTEFAASRRGRREPEVYVQGPFPLPPLHDYQCDVYDGLRKLFSSVSKRRRAVVSLPTGAGKTRVVVETAVRLLLAPSGPKRLVLWIAQTDELCEQAVQAFRQVWSNLGATRTDLRIIRLWGGNATPTRRSETSQPAVVVATIQTLLSRSASPALEWLRSTSLVVVDECHHAITKSYTHLLRWLGAADVKPEKRETPEPIMLGLSATPFRVDEEESKRLARRFSNQWYPAGQEHLYRKLRNDKILSHATYEAIESTAVLTEDEARSLKNLEEPWDEFQLQQILETINARLADDEERNEQILQLLQGSHTNSTLFFANSVAHARSIAMRLNLLRIPAAAVSGDTSPSARRYFLDRFGSGDLRVLCNHTVLTTGFDAPRTEMIVVSRNVSSPVRFMQMVGRGLRGPKNGGTPHCRIVTVLDNLGRFKDRHPYHYCKRYFT